MFGFVFLGLHCARAPDPGGKPKPLISYQLQGITNCILPYNRTIRARCINRGVHPACRTACLHDCYHGAPGHARAGVMQGGSWLGRGRAIQSRAICYRGGAARHTSFGGSLSRVPVAGYGPIIQHLCHRVNTFSQLFSLFSQNIDFAFLEHCVATCCDDTFLFLLVAFLLRPGPLRRVVRGPRAVQIAPPADLVSASSPP